MEAFDYRRREIIRKNSMHGIIRKIQVIQLLKLFKACRNEGEVVMGHIKKLQLR